MTQAAWSAAETAARDAYGRLLAWLSAQWRDVAAAEDALADAFESALRTWPRDGVPDAPDAWLLAAARRRMLHGHRHARVVRAHVEQTVAEADDAHDAFEDEIETARASIGDSRLVLMFACTHPAIDAAMRSALMLQVVLGLDAATLASAYLAAPSAMAQRLVRAKRRIAQAGIGFAVPPPAQRAECLHAVLEAIYAAYAIGWDRAGEDGSSPLAREAMFLADLVATLQPDDAEALGLSALLRFSAARAPARFDDAGRFVPLHAQDTARWDRAAIVDADRRLLHAARLRHPGPFQIEAAIQSAHCQRLFTGQVPWSAIATLYARLLHLAPTIGARIAHAVAVCECGDAGQADALLEAIDDARIARHQPYWTARAHVHAARGMHDAACAAYARAIGLTESPAVRAHLQGMAAAVGEQLEASNVGD